MSRGCNKPRSRINEGPGKYVTLFQRPSEALCRSSHVLGLKAGTQSFCCIESDPAAGDFGIGFALGYVSSYGTWPRAKPLSKSLVAGSGSVQQKDWVTVLRPRTRQLNLLVLRMDPWLIKTLHNIFFQCGQPPFSALFFEYIIKTAKYRYAEHNYHGRK